MFGKIGDDLGEWMRHRNIYYTLYYDLIDKIRAERSVVADLDRQLHYANRKYDALVNSLHAVTLEGYTISKIQREKGGETLFFFTKRDPTISGISFDIALRLYVCQDNVFEERYRAELTCNPGKEHMAIIDNYVIGERGQGYGSKGMEEIIHIAREQRLKMISGSLHPTDIGCNADNENRERVLRFYKKHGFTVQLAEDGNSGYVRLYL